VFKIFSSVKLWDVLIFSIVATLLISDLLIAYFKYQNLIFDMDSYIFYESARYLYSDGLAKIPFWVNSSTGLDIFSWGHYLPAFYYLLMHVFESGPNTIYFYQIIEKLIMLTLVLSIFYKFIDSRKIIILLLCFVLLDPLFTWFGMLKQYTRWPLIFGYFAIFVAIKIFIDKKVSKKFLSFIAPILLIIIVGMHASIGIPIAGSIFIFMLIEHFKSDYKYLQLKYYCFGILIGFLLLVLLILSGLTLEEMQEFLKIFFLYLHTMSVGGSWENLILQRGYFITNIFIPFQTISILGIMPFLLLFSLIHYQNFNEKEKFIIRFGVISFLTSLVFGMISPEHFTAIRMIWLMPIIVLLMYIISNKINITPVLLGVIFIVITTLIYQNIKINVSIYVLAVFALLAFSGLALIFTLYDKFSWPSKTSAKFSVYMLMALLLINSPILSKLSQLTIKHFDKNNTSTRFDLLKDAVKLDISLSKSINNLNNRNWILTNYPIRAFYEDDINIQIIRNHRGLMQGSRKKPCDFMYLIGKKFNNNIIAVDYSNSDPVNYEKTEFIYYRGHIYGKLEVNDLNESYASIIGFPVDIKRRDIKEDKIVSLDLVTEENLMNYFAFREKNDLKFR
jgi:hypothetical protein